MNSVLLRLSGIWSSNKVHAVCLSFVMVCFAFVLLGKSFFRFGLLNGDYSFDGVAALMVGLLLLIGAGSVWRVYLGAKERQVTKRSIGMPANFY